MAAVALTAVVLNEEGWRVHVWQRLWNKVEATSWMFKAYWGCTVTRVIPVGFQSILVPDGHPLRSWVPQDHHWDPAEMV